VQFNTHFVSKYTQVYDQYAQIYGQLNGKTCESREIKISSKMWLQKEKNCADLKKVLALGWR